RRRLAGLAHVRASPPDDRLRDRRAAPWARLARAAVHEELVLEGAAGAVDVAEVVDRGAARVDPRPQCLDHPLAQLRELPSREAPGRPARVHAGAEEGLVGIDVADPR